MNKTMNKAMTKLNVKNNHNGLLCIAGIEARSGATVAVDAIQFKRWANGNAAKIWRNTGIITVDDAAKASRGQLDQKSLNPKKQALLAQAKSLGLAPHYNTGVKKLQAMIEQAEFKKTGIQKTKARNTKARHTKVKKTGAQLDKGARI